MDRHVHPTSSLPASSRTTTSPRVSLSRRAVLGGAVALAGGAALAGCAPSNGAPSGQASAPSGTKPPAYLPFSGVEHDIAGTAEGVPPAVFRYPNPPIAREGFPLPAGEPFTALLQGAAKSIPDAENKNFDLLAENFGAGFEIIYGSYVNYREKFQVTVAGGDIPDLVQIEAVPQLPALLEKHFADLTDHLSGDAISDYPGLANIPTATWQVPSLNGRIWGVAMPMVPAGHVINTRSDILAEHGLDPNPVVADGAEFVALLKELTNRDKNQFAMGADPRDWLMAVMKVMCGTPNEWSSEGGTFVHENETEQMKDALDEAGKIVRAGYLHPNSFSEASMNKSWWDAGVTALYVHTVGGWVRNGLRDTDYTLGNVELPRWEGGGPAKVHKRTPGYPAYVAFRKADDERLQQLLRIADYIASPFGTRQFLDLNYGLEGYGFEFQQGEPTRLKDGPPTSNITYCGGNYQGVLYGAGREEQVRAQHDYVSRTIPEGLDNPTLGLYSETAVTKAANTEAEKRDVMREILLGNKPISAWDTFVKEWKAEVGDAMAAEYAEAASQSS